MQLKVLIKIEHLWGDNQFAKDEWGSINFLVGPNGTGKTQFIEALKSRCDAQGFKTRYAGTERLFGLEKTPASNFGGGGLNTYDIGSYESYKNTGENFGLSGDALIVIRERPDLRIKIEATLSQLFQRHLRFVETGGRLQVKIQKNNREYNFKDSESTGLKEIITLLTILYNDKYDCIILDEPELHLHPQFQQYILQEIRKIAGDPKIDSTKKCFFIITHSPYFIDIRTIHDLKNCIFFQPDKLPKAINELEGEDEKRIKRLLPRLNTHHKQLFFATSPIFVEGYRDQQIFSLIQEKRGKIIGASGSSIIDVGGKEDLDTFFRLCKKLELDARFITDLDTLLEGKLRQSISQDDRCREYLSKEGLGNDLMRTIGNLETNIDSCLSIITERFGSRELKEGSLQMLKDALIQVNKSDHKDKDKRYAFLVSLKIIRNEITEIIPELNSKLGSIDGILQKIINAMAITGVNILEKGELENYYLSFDKNPYKINEESKDMYFQIERDNLLNQDLSEDKYKELIQILDSATVTREIDLRQQINFELSKWMNDVQLAYQYDNARTIDDLKKNPHVEWDNHVKIFDVLEFTPNKESGFTCKIKLKKELSPSQKEITFTNDTVPSKSIILTGL